jgi:peroxiredoxin
VACGFSSESTGATAVSEPDSTTEPELAPDFTLTTLDGKEVSLSDYGGEWVILNFWATWCPPCISEMPYLQTLADRGLNVLGVNMAEPEEEVKLFTVKRGIKFPILMDPDDNLVLDYQARSLPRTVIIAPDGTIALRIAGPIEGEQLDPWLDDHGVQ